MIKSPEEIAQAGKDAMDALKKSGAAFTDGVGEISQHIVALTQQSVTANLTTGREVFNIRTPGDWIEFHSKWAGDCMTTAVTHMSHLSKLSTKLIDQTCEPLKTHFGATLGKNGGSQ